MRRENQYCDLCLSIGAFREPYRVRADSWQDGLLTFVAFTPKQTPWTQITFIQNADYKRTRFFLPFLFFFFKTIYLPFLFLCLCVLSHSVSLGPTTRD